MTKAERIHLIDITARLGTVLESLNKATEAVSPKERICIVCDQITALHGIIGDISFMENQGRKYIKG